MTAPVPQVMSWPLGGVDESGRLVYSRDDESVREVIRNILLTAPGERLMRPKFGAGLGEFIHQPNNETTRSLMASIVRKAIEQWETRVVVESVEVFPDRKNLSLVQVVIRYRMRYARALQQLSFGLQMNSLT